MIRHGMTEGNKAARYIGVTDEPLCTEGREQLQNFSYKSGECLFVSPLRRCRETADLLFPDQKQIVIEELAECNFGEFENKNYLELADHPFYQKWIDSNGELPFPEGESREEFITRCNKGFRGMVEKVEQIKEEGRKTIGMIVHGGTIMALLSKYGKGDFFDYQVANGKGYVCTMKDIDTKPEIIKLEKI